MADTMQGLRRTCLCGEVTLEMGEVVVGGFTQRVRDKGSLIFIDLRDKSGIVQLVFDETTEKSVFEKAESVRSEYVLLAKGTVRARESVNTEIKTGGIEIVVTELRILSKAQTPPFEIVSNTKTNECNDYYYIGDYTDLHPSIDAENDLLTINYGDSKNSSYRCFVIYKLSEAKKAPMTNVTITCTDGFQTDRPASTNPVSVVVRCHDLTTLTPVARPRFLKTGYGASGATYYDWQGYDVHKNRLYYTEGQSNYNLFGSFYSGSSFAYVTVFDFEGNIVEERTQVAVVSDKDKLTQIGVSVFGSLEAEGIKVCKDKLYLGYTARGITADNTKHYQNIFVFDPSSK